MSEDIINAISPEEIFNIIVIAGEAKSYLFEAFELVKSGEYEKSEELVKKASETLNGAHRIQTQLITLEAQGKKNEVGILMVHAQDHLMNCILTKELITHMIQMQKQINELKK